MIYKVGQKLQVISRKHLLKVPDINVITGSETLALRNIYFPKEMQFFCNKYVTIKTAEFSNTHKAYKYRINEDGATWSWFDWMFEDPLKKMLEELI
jgi:hypothetical protein